MAGHSEIKKFAERYYQLDVQKIAVLTSKIVKLTTAEQEYLLKFAEGDDEFIMKQLFAHKVLPQNVLPIYRTKDHTHEVKLQGEFVYLTDYIRIIPVPLEKQVDYYLDLLKKLHQETEIVVDITEEEIVRVYDQDYKKLQSSYGMLQRNMETFELKPDRSPYEWYFMMLYPMLYAMLHRANHELMKFYQLLKKEKKIPTCLVHGDINVANVLVSEKSTYLINFEKSDFAMSATDMCAFLRNYHQVPGTNAMLMDYIKGEKSPLLRHYFFFKSLCIDLEMIESTLSNYALTNIAFLNEMIAPHILALKIYDEIHKPPPAPEKKNPIKEALK